MIPHDWYERSREPAGGYRGTLELLRAQEWERKWLAEQLTDDVVQMLSQISRLLSSARSDQISVETLRQRTLEAARLSAAVSDRVRSLARELRPSVLDDFGLIPALRALAAEFALRNGVTARFSVIGEGVTATGDRGLTCYRVAQEAFSAVEGRQQVSQVDVRLVLRSSGIRLVVADDGAGPAPKAPDAPRGWSMGALHHRVEAQGGRLMVRSLRPRGVMVRLRLPADETAEIAATV